MPLGPLASHEFWIAPEKYQVESGSAIRADFKNGQEFKGATLSFFDRNSVRFDVAVGGRMGTVTARSGDAPALQLPEGSEDGLFVVLHETTPSTLTYKTWEKFAKFAAHKDFPDAEADHTAAGWPRDGFKERYTRHAKALIGVGDGIGADQMYGLATEFVALSNPYEAGFDGTMKIALYYGDALRPNAQVEVFAMAPDDTVTVTLHRTDAKGEAEIPTKPGHSYLFDAVVLRPAADAGGDPKVPVWETLWAALTFAVPQ